MNFKQWLSEAEEIISNNQEPVNMPDLKEVAYIGCVLHKHSQQALLAESYKLVLGINGTGIPKDWTGRAHHMTVKLGAKIEDFRNPIPAFGSDVQLTVTHIAADGHGVAVVVVPHTHLSMSDGRLKHVTVAHSRDVKPVYSNTLLVDKRNWHPVTESLILQSYLVCVYNDQNKVWPVMGDFLAIPSLHL